MIEYVWPKNTIHVKCASSEEIERTWKTEAKRRWREGTTRSRDETKRMWARAGEGLKRTWRTSGEKVNKDVERR
jgi:hypothetical protein